MERILAVSSSLGTTQNSNHKTQIKTPTPILSSKNSSKLFILGHRRISKFEIFFNPGEHLIEKVIEIVHSGTFRNFENQNFLQPWWTYSERKPCGNPSFQSISDCTNSKFSPTIPWGTYSERKVVGVVDSRDFQNS